jgi:NAD(P)-dependent dehydrogenase (short-subunit alcohol dehydrogenase family)
MSAIEFAPGLRVNGIAPGLILPPPGKDESYLAEMASTNPLKTYGSPDDIVEAVLFLLRSSFITGQVIYVDGGRHMLGGLYG